MKISVAFTGSISSGNYQCWENWYCNKGKIRQHFQGCLRPSCVRQLCLLHKSTYFYDMRTDFQRKCLLIHFLLYYFFQSLPDHLRPNFLARRSLAPQSLSPWLLAPQRSLLDHSFPLITLSPIACFLPPTGYLFFWCPNWSLIAWSLFLWFSKNNPKESR